MSKEYKRKIYMDILRILAIFMVLYNHQPTYTYFQEVDHQGGLFYVSIVLSIICKSAPPLFFMISGALLLKKDEEIVDVWKHRITRIIIVMLIAAIWSARSVLSVKTIVECFLNSNWYLYAYLAYLILLPFLRCMIRMMDAKAVRYFFVLAFFFYPISGIMAYLGAQNQFSYYMMFFTSDWPSKCWHLIFPVMGYYFANDDYFTDATNQKKIALSLLSATVVHLACGTVLMSAGMHNPNGADFEMIRQFFILAPTCFLFYIGKILFDKIQDNIPRWLERVIVIISSVTFGMYLLEVFTPTSHRIQDVLGPKLIPYVGVYLSYLLPIFVSFAVYAIVIFILKQIPYVKKLL